MKPQGKHARPRKKRGNEATPYIHAIALGCAYLPTLGTIRHLTGRHELLGHANPVLIVFVALPILFALYEVAIAILISAGCVIAEERHKTRAQREHHKALKRL
jgi:hypothetical protein